MRAPCVEWSGRLCGVAPFIFTWNPGLNSGHQVCDRCFTCWVILIDSPVFHCLINISILFHPPPHLSLPLCVHACMHTRVPDVRNHPQSAAVLVFEVGPQSNTANLFWRFHLCFPRPPHPPGIYMVLGIWNLAFPHAYRASTFPQLRFLCLRCRNLHFPEY